MHAPLDVYRVVESNDVSKFLFRTDSLFDALELISKEGLGLYLVLSKNTQRKRLYEVMPSGELVFREQK